MRASSVLVAVCLTACAPDASTFLSFPDVGTSESLLFAIERRGQLTYHAAEPDGRLALDLPNDEPAVLSLAAFDEPLTSMGLSKGSITTSADPFSRVLPAGVGRWRSDLVDGDVGAWDSDEGRAFERFRLPPNQQLATQCAWVAQTPIEIDASRFLSRTDTLDDGRAVVTLFDTLVLISPDGATEQYGLPVSPYRPVIGNDGTDMLLADGAGGLFTASFTGQTAVRIREIVAPGQYGRFLRSIRVTDGVVLATTDDEIFHMTDGRLTSLGIVQGATRLLAATGPNGLPVIAIGRTIFTLEGDALVRRMVLELDPIGLFSEAGGTLLVGLASTDTQHGRIARLDVEAGTRVDLLSTTTMGDTAYMVETTRGITYVSSYDHGGDIGATYHFVPGYGACEGALSRLEEHPAGLARLGDGFALFLGRQLPVTVLPFAPP